MGATKRNVNSKGSVMPVSRLVRAAERRSPPTAFFLSGFAVRYMAKAAPGRPNIIKGNFPAINLVASELNFIVSGLASSAKNMF